MISSSPSLLFKKRQSVQMALKARQSQNRFRLEALVDALLEPMNAMLGSGGSLSIDDGDGDKRTMSTDALAFGYLALLIYPDLSNNMLADIIRKRHPKVVQYIERLRTSFFGDTSFDAAQIMAAPSIATHDTTARTCGLPYRTLPHVPLTASIIEGSRSFISRCLRPLTNQPLLHTYSSNISSHPAPLLLRSWLHPLDILLSLAAPVLVGTGLFLYSATHADLERNKYFGKPKPKIRSLGAAGDMLSVFAMPGQGYGQSSYGGRQMQEREQDTPPTLVGHDEVIDIHVDVRDQAGS